MKKFIVVLRDKNKGTLTPELLDAHVCHLRKLTHYNELHLCGPFKDDDGALQIIIADNKQNAEKILNEDPFVLEKYYQSYEIYELIEANEANNWLYEDAQTKRNLE